MLHTHISITLGSDGPTYTYKNHVEGIEVGDHVVVHLPSGKFAVGAVQNVKPSKENRGRATKYIVCKVDKDAWSALTALDPPPEPEKKTYGDIWPQLSKMIWEDMIKGDQ